MSKTAVVKRPCAVCGKSQYRKRVWEQFGKGVICYSCGIDWEFDDYGGVRRRPNRNIFEELMGAVFETPSVQPGGQNTLAARIEIEEESQALDERLARSEYTAWCEWRRLPPRFDSRAEARRIIMINWTPEALIHMYERVYDLDPYRWRRPSTTPG
jgi:hypothetical protein